MWLPALMPNDDFAWASTCFALPSTFSLVPTVIVLLWKMTFAFALTSMSPSHSIVTSFFAVSRTILFFFVESTIVTFSDPLVSSKITR